MNAASHAGAHAGPLVDGAWLVHHHADQDVRVCDVRWVLGQPAQGRARYEAGHVPGAVFLDLDTELAGPPQVGPGRHPLPSREALATRLSALGLGDGVTVVAYDDAGGAAAARLWWLWQWLGHERVHVLDGGLAAYLQAGGVLTTQAVTHASRTLTLRPPRVRVVDKARVVTVARGEAGDALLLDARAGERYEGQVEPIDARKGHIPTARSAPFVGNLDASGQFRPPNALRERYEALGADGQREVIAYCGSGVTACHLALAMCVAGLPMPSLYEGSWSDWARDETLPAALGPVPGRFDG